MNSASKTTTKNDLTAQLQQIGLWALPQNLDDFLARASKARWSSHMFWKNSAEPRSRNVPAVVGTAAAPVGHQKLQTLGRLRVELADQDRSRCH